MTQHRDCNKLDAYLADDLSVDDVSRFESHLEACAECREAIDEQNWVDALLQSPLRLQIERPPATTLDLIHTSVANRNRRTMRSVFGLAAAAVLLIGLGWIALHRPAAYPKASATQDIAAVKEIQVPAHVEPQAMFVATSDAIVVPLDSPSTDVTVVQVYPTTETERRRRLEQTLLSASTLPNGG